MSKYNNFEMTEVERQHSVLSTITNMLIARGWVSDNYDEHLTTLKGNNELIDTTQLISDDIKVIVKFYNIKLNSLKNDREIENFITKYPDHHKILIVSNIMGKILKQINEIKNFEAFEMMEVVRDISKHHLVPKHILLDDNEAKQVMDEYQIEKADMGRIFIDDPMTRYLYGQKNNIIKIIRNSIYTGYSINYRLVVLGSIHG